MNARLITPMAHMARMTDMAVTCTDAIRVR